jgi:serpin B
MRHNGLHIVAGVCALALAYGCTEIHPIDPVEAIEEHLEEGKEDPQENPEEGQENPPVADPIVAGFPAPATQLGPMTLEEKEKALSEGIGRFGFGLLSKLYEGESTVISPLSLELALSMAADGAAGETLSEILAAMGVPAADHAALDAFNKRLIELLPAVDTSIRMNCVNALIADNQAPLVSDYVSSVEKNYYAAVRNMDFEDFAAVKATVNDWCHRTTNGLIPTIIDQDERNNALAFLINLLYMKAPWTFGFDKESQVLKGAGFKSASGETVPRDYLTTVEGLEYIENDTFTAVVRKLGIKHRYSFTILLPKAERGVADVLQRMTSGKWTEILGDRKHMLVSFRLPMFETENSFDLVQTLQETGIQKAFDKANADFSKMFRTETAIDKVVHKTKLVVDTDGIEGAAATAIGAIATAGGGDEPEPEPILFWADHPFVYAITEDSSNTILFLGVYDGE